MTLDRNVNGVMEASEKDPHDNQSRVSESLSMDGTSDLPESSEVMAFRLEFVLLVLLLSLVVDSAHSDDGATLLEIKKSFRDVDNVLYDWTESPASDYCVWRGVICDNITFNVIALLVCFLVPMKAIVILSSGLNLDGEISPAIGNLKDLTSIDLRGNRLSGQIPDEIGDCSSLRNLDLSFNDIYGDIPFSISKLKQLEVLVLKNNQLIGPIPSTLSQIPNLKILDLAQNRLSGEIPRLLYWNEVLQYLDLSYNQLTGEIPFNIGFLQIATLYVVATYLYLVNGLIFDGMISSLLTVLATGCDARSLQGNRLTGKIPSVIGLMQALAVLELNDNQLTGHIPPELGKLTDLFDLNVANNQLEGPIPDNLSSCTNLNSLNVHGNKLNGTIPRALQRLESMTYLNLSSNNIKGPIPIELSRIGNLDTLDISNNRISGSIPSSLGDLEHLLKLNLSRNQLIGFIPAEFGNLRSVMEIDLSDNHLSRSIPQELSQLQNLFLFTTANTPLMHLRLEKNNLSGDVMSLINCLSLSVLNVSYNNLAGVIPTSNNFSRFTPDSFIGNPGLCGYWLSSLCHDSHPAERATISKAAILGIALGALVILLMILVAACRPHNPVPFPDGSLDKPGIFSLSYHINYSTPKLVILNMNMALHVYEDIMRMTENLSEKYIIGHGASSTVYKCVLKNCRPVAIKRLYSHYPQCLKEFETELETVGSIKHRNLVSLQGYSLSPSGNLLFYDYMENGSLWDFLHGPTRKKKLDWDTRLQILSKTANNAVMETVDPEITATCKDLGAVKKVFQLALLCTKRQPTDRPTMHEVTRVLGSLVPPITPPKQCTPAPPAPLPSAKIPCYMDEYANIKTPHILNCPSMSTSDAQLFLKFVDDQLVEIVYKCLESNYCSFVIVSAGPLGAWCVGLQPQALASGKMGWQCIICVISNNSLASLNCAVSYACLDVDVSQ
ncbi:unnamed protein product [Dovyalis caffra]|uniref:Protein kinase domain-containing protein n=1 Tax=Dovyalis caffra TaxID=77055 RepID=A0AAV1SMR7_9ROSI|nr:unnamed protein product [Dovyalis caffra]